MATSDFRIYTADQDAPQGFIDGVSTTDLPYGDGGNFLLNGNGSWTPGPASPNTNAQIRRQYIADEAVHPNLGAIPDTKAITVEAFFTRGIDIQTTSNRGISCGVAALTGGGTNADNGSVKGYILNYGVGGGSAGWYSAAAKGHTTYEDAIWMVAVAGLGSANNSDVYESAILASAVKGSSVGLRLHVIPVRNSSGVRLKDVVRGYANIGGGGWSLLHEQHFYAGVDRGYMGDGEHGTGHWGHATTGGVGFYINAAGGYDPAGDSGDVVVNNVGITDFLASVEDA